MASIATPAWVKHAIFYQIFPDRFASSERVEKPDNLEPWDGDPTQRGYKGGDLLGVVERLDYLQELGITALYFNPIFQSASNHRYHTHDYYHVDPLLGGDAAFDELMAECKRRGIRVVLDGVFNHASRGFFQFNDILENGAASPWLDWFTFAEHPANAYDHALPPGYTAWVGLHALPKLNTENPQVREYLMRIGEYWIRKGIDGWRLDVPFEITSLGFWAEFRTRIKAINPDAYIVGEVWGDARDWLRGDQFDGVMNYLFTEAAIGFAAGDHVVKETVVDRDYAPWPGIDAAAYRAKIDALLTLYPWPIQLTQFNLLDSHDTSRFVTIAGDDAASVRLATLLLFTFPGAPSIYYGDEIGLTGALPDHWARKSFPWDHPEHWKHDTLAYHKSVIAMRKALPALNVGDYRSITAQGGAYVFTRSTEDQRLIVTVNAGASPASIQIPKESLPIAAGTSTVRFATGDGVSCEIVADHMVLDIPSRTGAVIELDPVGLDPT